MITENITNRGVVGSRPNAGRKVLFALTMELIWLSVSLFGVYLYIYGYPPDAIAGVASFWLMATIANLVDVHHSYVLAWIFDDINIASRQNTSKSEVE